MSEWRLQDTLPPESDSESDSGDDGKSVQTAPRADDAAGDDALRWQATMAPGAGDTAAAEDWRLQQTAAPYHSADRTPDPDQPLERAAETRTEGRPANKRMPASGRTSEQTTRPGPKSLAKPGPAGEPQPGMTIAKYELIRDLGRGGMGSVFLARDVRLGRLVALKFLIINNARLAEQFIIEARTTARCNHENIVVLHEADEFHGMPYMVLEYLEGKSLAVLLDEQRRSQDRESGQLVPVARVVELMVPVLAALERAHGMGIVHRDLKPANVMLTDTGTVKVLDFGIAQVLASETQPGRVGAAASSAREPDGKLGGMSGTLPYMSPEQLRGEPVDGRTDIWAIGVMMHEMATGQHPLGMVSMKVLEGVSELDVPMPRVSERRPELGALGAIIDRCLIKRVDDRIDSATALLRELRPLIQSRGGSSLGADESPFTGLSAFQETDADRFFGRADDIANVVARIRNQPLVAVVGPSGVGKSSLVRAGAIPTLKRSGEGWESVTLRPGRTPLTALMRVLELTRLTSTATTRGPATSSGMLGDMLGGTSGLGDDAHLASDELAAKQLHAEPGLLGAELRAWAQRKLRKLVIFIDQFEEIYTATDSADERAVFLACLEGMADDPSSPLRVVFSIRADFLERMAEDRSFMAAATRGLVFLAPMGRAGLRQALEKPLEAVGYQFESRDMVGEMLDELEATPGALPLMQFTASHLWDARDRKRRLLTEASYRDMGGIAGTLARHADQVLAGMSAQRVKLARALFERLVTPERTRAIVSLDELLSLPWPDEAIEDVLQVLADARLLVVESGATAAASLSESGPRQRGSVEIVHESLIVRWPTLRRWLDENQDDAEFLARLRAAAREWHRSGRAHGTLWRGEVAAQARRWHEHYSGTLPEREQHYLSAVFAHADRSLRRRRQLLTGSVAILAVIAVVATVGIVQLMRQNDTIRQQIDEVERKNAEVLQQRELVDEQRALVSEKVVELERTVTREQASRAQADRAREEAEQAREEAERARAEAEQARLLAEQARALAAERERDARAALGEAQAAGERARKAQKAAQASAARERQAAAKERASRVRLQETLTRQQKLLDRFGISKPDPE